MLREGASAGRVALVGHSVAHRFGYGRHHSRKVVHLSVAVADEEYVASLLGTARNGRAEQEGYGEKGFLEHCGAVFCFCRLAGVLFAQHYFVEGCDIDLNVVYVGIRVDRNQGGLDELIAFEVEEVALPESLSKIILIFELIYFVWRFETTHLLHYEKIIYSFSHSNYRLTSVGTDHLQD